MAPAEGTVNEMERKLYIDGAWIDAAEGNRVEIGDPATGERSARVRSPPARTSTGPSPRQRKHCQSGRRPIPTSAPGSCIARPT